MKKTGLVFLILIFVGFCCGSSTDFRPVKEDADYPLHFLKAENNRTALSGTDVCIEEADYFCPDTREGNAAIEEFADIYFINMVNITKNGRTELIVIAKYEKDGVENFDTRVYEINENGANVNFDLIQKWNEQYCNGWFFPF